MLELVATCRPLSKQRKLEVSDGEVICVGRQPKTGFGVPWDSKISREHVEVTVAKNKLKVRRLDGARNPVFFQEKPAPSFTLKAGQEFRIGQTFFKLVATEGEAKEGLGDRIGAYAIKKVVGDGSLGTVHGAIDSISKQQIALKVLRNDLTDDSEFVDQFIQEARRAVDVQHVHIVRSFAVGRERGYVYVASEFIRGAGDVGRLVKQQGMLPIRRTMEIMIQAAEALQHAHSLGLVHRNMSPANILIRAGGVKLADLGLCRPVDAVRTAKPREDGSFGIIDYVAPEQVADFNAGDARSDLYSLGCVWYEMLTGVPPFQGKDLAKKLSGHASGPIPNPQQRQRKTSNAMAEVVQRMMAKSPADRYQTADELLDDLNSTRVKGIWIECSVCHKSYTAPGSAAGKTVTCKNCETKIRVPDQL